MAKTKQTVRTGYRCPLCERPGYWRSGIHFEHEMRCGFCDLAWEPGETYEVEVPETQPPTDQAAGREGARR